MIETWEERSKLTAELSYWPDLRIETDSMRMFSGFAISLLTRFKGIETNVVPGNKGKNSRYWPDLRGLKLGTDRNGNNAINTLLTRFKDWNPSQRYTSSNPFSVIDPI